MGRGFGSREVLRPCEPRHLDVAGGTGGKGQAGIEAHPPLSRSRRNARRVDAAAHGGDAARRSAHATNAKDNFQFERRISGWRSSGKLDFRRKEYYSCVTWRDPRKRKRRRV